MQPDFINFLWISSTIIGFILIISFINSIIKFIFKKDNLNNQ